MYLITVVATVGAVRFTAAGSIGPAEVALPIIRTTDEWLGPRAEFEILRQWERRLGSPSLSSMAFAAVCIAVRLIYYRFHLC